MNPRQQRQQLLLNRLHEEIGLAMENAVVGQNMSTALVHQLKRTAQSILYKHNIRKSQIDVVQQRNGFVVTVTLPPQGPIVQTVRLQFG